VLHKNYSVPIAIGRRGCSLRRISAWTFQKNLCCFAPHWLKYPSLARTCSSCPF